MEIMAFELDRYIGKSISMLDNLTMLWGEVMSFKDKGEYIKVVLFDDAPEYPRTLILEVPRDKSITVLDDERIEDGHFTH